MLTKIISITFLVIAMIIAGFVFLRPGSEPQQTREVAISDEAASNDTASDEDTFERELLPYSPESLSEAITQGNKVLIFFHAQWCPFCVAAEKDILSKYDQIPEGITILKADYDTEKSLRKQYDVTTQHTFVQVDQAGNEVTKWVGGDSLEEIVSRVE